MKDIRTYKMSSTEAQILTGRVKWFNNKDGFGFINVCEDGEFSSKDIFVHWNSIQVQTSQYKYLVQGEYVEFSLAKPEKGTHEFHAVGVRGLKGGPLMCETRRTNTQRVREPSEGDAKPERVRRSRPPRDESNAGEFTQVRRNRPRRAPRETAPVTNA
jgi:cold shock CspA family protein